MFIHKTEKDFFGNNQTHYWLTQGDSCAIISTPKDSSGTVVDPSLINFVKFKILNSDTKKIVYAKTMGVYSTNKYMLNFTSTESAAIPVGRYDYEIEYTLEDGGVNTVHQWKWDIIPQGVEGTNE